MSASPKEQRLRLFRGGNDRCPICMAVFTEQDVATGKVGLEDVPAKALHRDAIAMCLTCRNCNQSGGRVEQRVSDEAKGKPTARVNICGLPTFSARIEMRDGRPHLQIQGRGDVSQEDFATAAQGGPLKAKVKMPAVTPHYMDMPWLKAAYLSVFSLLGPHGYSYAESAAVEVVREQIMNADKEIIPRFAGEASGWHHRDGMIASQETPGWVVKLGSRVVLLPRGWDREFYNRIDNASDDEVAVDGSGIIWYPARFGANRRVRVFTVPGEPLEAYGENLFGSTGQVTGNDKMTPFVVVGVSGRKVTVMITAGVEDLGPLL